MKYLSGIEALGGIAGCGSSAIERLKVLVHVLIVSEQPGKGPLEADIPSRYCTLTARAVPGSRGHCYL